MSSVFQRGLRGVLPHPQRTCSGRRFESAHALARASGHGRARPEHGVPSCTLHHASIKARGLLGDRSRSHFLPSCREAAVRPCFGVRVPLLRLFAGG
eukprot:6194638-Pleurochrysis_carterae.AAC.1